MLGPHLTMDLYGCDAHALSSKELIYVMLDELPGLLKMRKITKPQILPYGGTKGTFDRGGISAFVIIATSHISIHTFVRQRYASIDIFSSHRNSARREWNPISFPAEGSFRRTLSSPAQSWRETGKRRRQRRPVQNDRAERTGIACAASR